MRKPLIVFLAAAALLAACRRSSDVPRLYPLPQATLVSQDNRQVSLQSVGGKVAVYDFIFTSCTSTCPVMTANMKSLAHDLDSADVRFVSISVDPSHDTPAVLKDYWQKTAGAEPRWIFLTGPVGEIAKLSVEGFKLAASVPTAGDEPLLHSTRFVLVDAQGYVRGYYDSNSDGDRRKLVSDVKAILRG